LANAVHDSGQEVHGWWDGQDDCDGYRQEAGTTLQREEGEGKVITALFILAIIVILFDFLVVFCNTRGDVETQAGAIIISGIFSFVMAIISVVLFFAS